MPEIILRPAVPADAAGMARVHVDSWRESYGGIVPEGYLNALSVPERTRRWQDMLESKQSPWEAFVAVSGKEGAQGPILGFVSCGGAREGFSAHAGELYALYLLRSAQGAGAGRRLFDAARQNLRSCDISGMYLWVLADNPAAGFYRHMGGQELARKTIDIGGKPLLEIAYGWKE